MNYRFSLLSGLALATALIFAGCGNRESATDATVVADAQLDGTLAPGMPGPSAPAPVSAMERMDSSDLPRLGEAPSWQLTRIDGTSLSSEDLKGKVVVVDFWATWCGPCRVEIPGYVQMQKEFEEDGLVIVGVSLDQQGPDVVRQFADRFEINYPLVMGDQKTVSAFGGVQAIPTTFLIDRNGQLRHKKVGAMEREDYEPLVVSLLK